MTEIVGRRCRHCGAALLADAVYCGRCGGSVETPVTGGDPVFERVRELFRGELEMERELGRGGMAAVFLAFDPALQRRVAVKALLPEFAEDPAMAERFVREARTVAALQHPHVVSIFGVRAGGGVQAIVMEFVEGRSLDVVLAERGKMHIGVASLVLSQVAAGLVHAHDRGVVHRDVKPANVILDRDGRAVVSDFGIARRQGMPRLTGTGRVVGTLAYMSPEQRAGMEATPAADQYAFGVMAFELLTGRLPFLGSAVEINTAHLVDDPPTLRSLRAEIPAAVETMVLRMLSKEPESRFRSLRDAERLLRSIVPDAASTTVVIAGLSHALPAAGSAVFDAITSPISVPSIPAAPAGAKKVKALPAPAGGSPAEPPPTKRATTHWPVRSAVITSVMLIVALVVWRLAGSSSSPSSPPPTNGGQPIANEVQPNVPGPGAPVSSDRSERRAAPPVASTRGANLSAAAQRSAAPAAADTSTPTSTRPADVRQTIATPRESVAGPPPGRPDSASRSAATTPTATVADARRVANDFVRLLNQGKWQEVQRLVAGGGGEAVLRDSLVRLTQSAAGFAAGFDRVPSALVPAKGGFETDFVLDLEWRGGQKLMLVRATAVPGPSGWQLASASISRAE